MTTVLTTAEQQFQRSNTANAGRVCREHLQDMLTLTGEVLYAPIGAAPANIGVGRRDTIDTGLAVDSEEAATVESHQLVLDVSSLQLQAVHLTPWQHVHACACGPRDSSAQQSHSSHKAKMTGESLAQHSMCL